MVQLNNSTSLILYKETTLTIPANGSYTYQNPYQHIRILDSTGSRTALLYRFGASSLETPLTVGLGLTLPELLPSITIRNVTSAPVVLTISESSGEILDDRLTITGDVETKQEPDTQAVVNLITFPASGEISIDSTGYRNVLIQNMSATDDVFCFNNNTFKISPNGTFEKQFAGAFSIYGTVGETVSVGYFA